MTAIVGSAAVSIVPSMLGFAERVRAAILPEADRIGQDFGAAIGRNARERLALEMRNLPDAHVNVDLDTGDAQAKLAVLDEEVQKVDRDARSAGSGFNLLSGGVSGLGVTTAALLPALPELAGGLLAVGGAFATAGTSAAAGALVLATGVAKAVEANKELEQAQQAVNDATTAKTRQAALAKQAALIDELGGRERLDRPGRRGRGQSRLAAIVSPDRGTCGIGRGHGRQRGEGGGGQGRPQHPQAQPTGGAHHFSPSSAWMIAAVRIICTPVL